MPHFEFRLEKFQGPLDLLLELIESNQLEISEISLAQVTDQYLSYIRDQENLSPSELADFLVVAAQLLLIKSRALLPRLKLSDEEEAEIHDLELALREYQRYKGAARILLRLSQGGQKIVTRPLWSGLESAFSPPPNLDGVLLSTALERVVYELAKFLRPLEQSVVRRVMSLEERIKHILKRVEKKAKMTLGDLSPSKQKLEVILAFLAILFLFKEKMVHLLQPTLFGEIEVRKQKSS